MSEDALHTPDNGKGRNIVELPESCLALCNELKEYIFVLDLEGAILFVNKEIEKKLAYPRAQILGTNVLKLHPPERRREALTVIQNIMDGKTRKCHIPLVDRHGRQVPIEASVYRIRFMEQEALLAVSKENKDSTIIARTMSAQGTMEMKLRSLQNDLIKREKAFKEDLDQLSRKFTLKEHQLRAILDNISDFAWFKDRTGKYIMVNEYFAKKCRIMDPMDLVGKTDFDMWPHHLALSYVNDDKKVMKNRKPSEKIERMADSELKNEYRWVQTFKTPVCDTGGHTFGTVGIARDITERKQWVEDVERYNERLKSLAAHMMETEEIQLNMISRTLHDYIGQNLNTAVLNLNMLQGHFKESCHTFERTRLEESLSLISDSISQIRNLISDIRSPVIDDHGLTSAIRHLCHRWKQRSGVTFITRGKDISPRPPRNVENGLYRIADEAINNAVKHARASKVTIVVKKLEESVLLTVADDGIGFNWTVHVESNDRKKWGLILMRERVLEMGGQIDVTSRENRGTKIKVEIPYEH